MADLIRRCAATFYEFSTNVCAFARYASACALDLRYLATHNEGPSLHAKKDSVGVHLSKNTKIEQMTQHYIIFSKTNSSVNSKCHILSNKYAALPSHTAEVDGCT